MNIGLILELLKISAEIFQDERRDRFLKKAIKLKQEWHDELSKPDTDRSDLAMDRLLLEIDNLSKLIIAESQVKS